MSPHTLPGRTTPFLIVLTALFGVLAGVVQGADQPGEKPVLFVVSRATGEPLRGPVRELGDSWKLRLGTAETPLYQGDDWLTLRRADHPLPANPTSAQLIFTNGDRLPLDLTSVKLVGERLSFTHPLLGEGKPLQVPLPVLSVLWLQPPDQAANIPALLRRLASDRHPRDVVWLQNGDQLEGVLDGLQKQELRLDVARKLTTIPLSKVSALTLSSELSQAPRPRGPHARLVLADGTRLTMVELSAASGKPLRGKTAFGATVEIPLQQVIALDRLQARAVYLDELQPVRYEHTPYLDLKWNYTVGASVDRGDLRLARGTHDRGIGMHSASRLTYHVPAGAQRFEALVGLDEIRGRAGSVRLQVLVDDRPHPLEDNKDVTVARGALPVRLDVRGAKTLTLVVEFGQRGDVGDHVNWVDARFIK